MYKQLQHNGKLIFVQELTLNVLYFMTQSSIVNGPAQ